MKTEKFQRKLDYFISKYARWLLPKRITPNMLSWFRLAAVPLLAYLLLSGQIVLGFALFILSALTDALDGVIARTRHQISDLGKALDPIADKALIATMIGFLGFQYLIVKIFLIFIIFEIVAVLLGLFFSFKFGRVLGANIFGKVKMLLQTLAVIIFGTGIALKSDFIINVATYVLFAALFFALLAGIGQLKRKWPKIIAVLKA